MTKRRDPMDKEIESALQPGALSAGTKGLLSYRAWRTWSARSQLWRPAAPRALQLSICFIGSAYGVPISYMLYVDAYGYAKRGIAGSLAMDAVAGILSSALLGGMLLWFARRPRVATA